jgi:nucleoside-diphosphate-sugar epimerase
MSGERILVTGASGELGLEVLREFSRSYAGRDVRLVLLLRARDGAELRQRLDATLAAAHVPPDQRITAIAGDITQPGVVADPARRSSDVTKFTGILHLAADTRFSRPLAHARGTNRDGTLNVLRLAAGSPGCRFGHASTLFVSGTLSGDVPEAPLEEPPGFVSTYEQSKWEAEAALRTAHVPTSIYRCALMPSRADGVFHRNAQFHLALAFYHRGLVGFIPGVADCPVDVMPTDVTAAIILRLFLDHFTAGQTYNIALGSRAPTIGEIMTLAQRTFARAARAPVRWDFDLPEFVPLEVFDELYEAARIANNARLARAMWLIRAFAPQLLYPKRFVVESLERLGLDGRPAQGLDFIERCIEYCLATNWLGADLDNGRRASVAS